MKDTLGIIGIIIAFVALLALEPLFIMLLWNWLMPSLFGLSTISFWKALGIKLLVVFLFGGLFSPNGKKN